MQGALTTYLRWIVSIFLLFRLAWLLISLVFYSVVHESAGGASWCASSRDESRADIRWWHKFCSCQTTELTTDFGMHLSLAVRSWSLLPQRRSVVSMNQAEQGMTSVASESSSRPVDASTQTGTETCMESVRTRHPYRRLSKTTYCLRLFNSARLWRRLDIRAQAVDRPAACWQAGCNARLV